MAGVPSQRFDVLLPRRPCAEASATRKVGEHLQSRRRWCRWHGALSRSVGETEPRHRILALAMVQLADSALCRPLKPFVFDDARSVRTPRRLVSKGGLVMVSAGRAAGDERIHIICRHRCRARFDERIQVVLFSLNLLCCEIPALISHLFFAPSLSLALSSA